MNAKFTEADVEWLENQLHETEGTLQEVEKECAGMKGKQHFLSAVFIMMTRL